MRHYKFSFLLAFIVLVIACKTDIGSNKIAQLEKTVLETPTVEVIQQLQEAYQASIQMNVTDTSANAITVGKIAELQVKNNQIQEAVQTLTDGIRSYYSASGTADNVWALGNIYQNNLKNTGVANAIFKMYADKFPSGTNIAAAKQLIAQDSVSLSERIDAIGGNMYNEQTHRLDSKAANDFIRVCELYALLKPKDSKSPDYLHKAGETARAIRAFPQAIEIYNRISTSYPTYEKAPQALFLRAFTYDNDLNDIEKAKALYTEFLQKYPNDDFADDTAFLLKNLGKDDEEIIKEFSKEKE